MNSILSKSRCRSIYLAIAWKGDQCGPGFTLMELLIALTITSVTVILVFASLRIGFRAWEKGESDINFNQQQRIAFELLKNQLSSAVVTEKPPSQSIVPPVFSGNKKNFIFKSSLSLHPDISGGNVFVRYRVEVDNGSMERLVVSEIKESSARRNIQKDKAVPDTIVELVTGAYSISFEYLPRIQTSGSVGWIDQWNIEGDLGPPKAVRIAINMDRESLPIIIIARIESNEKLPQE